MSRYIDLNCDMGEGETEASAALDRKLMRFISSCSIACGGHAGSEHTMRQTVASALDAGLRIGAHPSYPDQENFGRQSMLISGNALSAAIIEQTAALEAVVDELGGTLSFVKPHGALYNDMARDAELTSLVVRTIKNIDPTLKIMGLAGSHCRAICEDLDMPFLGEAFADRRYTDDGQLSPRSQIGAVITQPETAVEQIISIVEHKRVESINRKWLPLQAQSICVHSDTPGALEHLKLISKHLISRGLTIGAT
tara:strand:+ start:9163 stop:9921 length:759 start_codon:yes stop_codon:yes gene_type:complete